MKSGGGLALLILLGSLLGCSTDKDNSESPAPLTRIDNKLPLKVNWKHDTSAASNRASYRLQPLLADDLVYSIDTRGSVVCVDAVYGDRRWRHETGLASIAGLGGDRETLIVSSRDGDVAAYRILDKGLEKIWQTSVGSEIRATPVLDTGQVFVRSTDGKIRSLNAADGAEQWVVSRRVPVLSLTGNSEPLVEASMVYAGFDDGKLVAMDRASGEIRWEATVSLPSGRTEVERLVDIDGRFELRDGVIYVSSFQGRLAAVQAVSGDLLWSRQFSSFQPIAIDENAIYLIGEGSDIWAIDRRTGSAFWKQDVLHARKLTAPTLFEGYIVVADLHGYQHWLDKQDGRLAGRIHFADTRVFVQPQVWRKSVLTLDKFGYLASVSLDR